MCSEHFNDEQDSRKDIDGWLLSFVFMVNKRLLEVEFRFHNDNFRHGCHRAGTEIQGKLNHFKAWEKSEILLRVREKLHL